MKKIEGGKKSQPTHPSTNPPTHHNKAKSSFKKGGYSIVFLKPQSTFLEQQLKHK